NARHPEQPPPQGGTRRTPPPPVPAGALAIVPYLLASAPARLPDRDAEARDLRSGLDRAREHLTAAEAARARAEGELKVVAEKQPEAFAALSQTVLQASSEQFLQLARESLGTLHEAARGDLDRRQQAIVELVK